MTSNKFILSLIIASSVFGLVGCQNDANIYGYDFQTARITYKISGYSEGTSEVIIKGDRKVIKHNIVQSKSDGTKNEINTLLIQDADKNYTLDMKSKSGSVVKQPFYAELLKLNPEQRKARMVLEAIREEGSEGQDAPKPESTETVAGQKCEVYSGKITKTCLWQGIPLKTIASLPDFGIQTETIATKIELNKEIADSEFDVPSDYQIKELN
jgi:hypothetical protein